MTTKMVIQQPRPVVETLDSNQWSSGICDCCENKADCCFAFWCMPCYTCRTSRRYGECLCLPLLNAFGCVQPITFGMRVSMRERYKIKGTMCKDCVYATFCGPCSWCQMSREITWRTQPITLINAKVKQ